LANGDLLGNLSLPLAPTKFEAEPTRTASTKPALPKQISADLRTQVAAAEAEARQAASELSDVREASALADGAVKSAEDSLKALRQSAAKLAAVVSTREAAARQAAQKAAELRAQADSAEASATNGAADRRIRREQIQKRLTERRSLLESAKQLAERVEHGVAQSPDDARLEAAGRLAAELRSKLAQDVEETTGELKQLEAPTDTAQK
jgi:DNA repair exonuclease SbcCD ATPase subunit